MELESIQNKDPIFTSYFLYFNKHISRSNVCLYKIAFFSNVEKVRKY